LQIKGFHNSFMLENVLSNRFPSFSFWTLVVLHEFILFVKGWFNLDIVVSKVLVPSKDLNNAAHKGISLGLRKED